MHRRASGAPCSRPGFVLSLPLIKRDDELLPHGGAFIICIGCQLVSKKYAAHARCRGIKQPANPVIRVTASGYFVC